MTMFAASLLVLGLFSAEHAAPAPPPAAADCRGAEHRQFDFWIGDWEVSAQDKPAGRNTISREQSGCVLREEWRGGSGLTGTSLNFYDRRDQRWHQVWIDGRGGVLRLSGSSPHPGVMLLESSPDAEGPRQRIRWTLRDDGVVEQHWEQSSDDGATWSTAFLGEYRRRQQ